MEFLSKIGQTMGNIGDTISNTAGAINKNISNTNLGSMGNMVNYDQFIRYFNSLSPEEQKRLLALLAQQR